MPRKIRYHFNVHSLSIEKVRITFKDRFKKLSSIAAFGMVFAAVVLLIAYNFFNSPKEKILTREIEQYKQQYDIMNNKLNNISAVLKDMENRDDNIYSVIFEAEPIPNSVWIAGIGGSDRY